MVHQASQLSQIRCVPMDDGALVGAMSHDPHFPFQFVGLDLHAVKK